MADRTPLAISVKLVTTQGSERIPLESRLISLSYEDTESRTDKVVITLNNFDLAIFDDAMFLRGHLLEVSWGYLDRMSVPRSVIITKIKGFKTLTIEGTSTAILLNRIRESRSFNNMSRSQVVRRLVEECGFPVCFIEDTGIVYETLNQAAETRAEMIRRLANLEGFQFYVDQAGVHFHQRQFGSAPIREYIYYTDPREGDILDFNVESEVYSGVGRTSVSSRDPNTGEQATAESSNSTNERDTLGQTNEVVDPAIASTIQFLSPETEERSFALHSVDNPVNDRNARETSGPTPEETTEEAQRVADARYRLAEQGNIKASMKVVGDPDLLAKSVIKISNISDYLSGLFYVESVTHKLDSSGYVCDAKLRKSAPEILADRGEGDGTSAGEDLAGRANDKGVVPPDEPEQVQYLDEETTERTFAWIGGTLPIPGRFVGPAEPPVTSPK